jgi:hypothetical protein
MNKYWKLQSNTSKIEPKLKHIQYCTQTAFEVKAIEKFKAATSAANYQAGNPDGSRP